MSINSGQNAYDRRAHAFFSAICIAATVVFWLGQRVLTLGRNS